MRPAVGIGSGDHSDPRSRNPWWTELLYVAAFYAAYSLVRNLFGSAAVAPDEALANALRVIDAERFLGLYLEEAIQGWFVSTGADGATFAFSGAQVLVRLWNVFYSTMHFVVTAGVLIWLYLHSGTNYSRWRNTLAFTTGFALIVYALFPLMPPRLLPDCGMYGACLAQYAYVDTLADVGGLWSFDSSTVQSISNQYAAMPSLHFAWAMWVFLALRRNVANPWGRAAVALYPLLTLWVIVVTANHFWLDALGGAAILGAGYATARFVASLRS